MLGYLSCEIKINRCHFSFLFNSEDFLKYIFESSKRNVNILGSSFSMKMGGSGGEARDVEQSEGGQEA